MLSSILSSRLWSFRMTDSSTGLVLEPGDEILWYAVPKRYHVQLTVLSSLVLTGVQRVEEGDPIYVDMLPMFGFPPEKTFYHKLSLPIISQCTSVVECCPPRADDYLKHERVTLHSWGC